MTYIRMTGGRDRGHVKYIPLPDAQEMLALGQALPVDFDEPDALGFRELDFDQARKRDAHHVDVFQQMEINPLAATMTILAETAHAIQNSPSNEGGKQEVEPAKPREVKKRR
jgi:hypothetical protein